MNAKLEKDAVQLLSVLLRSQWNFSPDYSLVKDYPILTKSDFRKIEQRKGLASLSTSGSTGEPIIVEKYYTDFVWNRALSYRFIINRKTDVSLDVCKIYSKLEEKTLPSWGLPKSIFPKQGKYHIIGNKSIKELQSWIEKHNPSYIICTKTVSKQLDTSKLSNFVRFSTLGEPGASTYSSEEFGMIAFECPDNPEVYHINENMIVESGKNNEAIITSHTSPYLKRYLIGDHIEFGECFCGRSLPVLKKIYGRTRNLMSLPDNNYKWPNFSSLDLYKNFKISQFQVIQENERTLHFYIVGPKWNTKNNKKISDLVYDAIGYHFNISVTNISQFPPGKFEEFKNLMIS